MGKREPSDSEIESEKLSGSEEEAPGKPVNSRRNVAEQRISEYEKQRLSRIAENKARMEALGLRKMASSLMSSAQKSSQPRKTNRRKGKSKVVDDDDDDYYMPNDDDDDDDDDDGGGDGDDFEEDEDYVDSKCSSKTRRNKVKNKSLKAKKKTNFQKDSISGDYINEVDEELMQAIALSLQDSVEDASLKQRKGNTSFREDAGRSKRKKSFNNRVQMTEDELILHFFQFDTTGSGFLTVRDLRRVATAHDFTWTDKELTDMICCFDSDGDAKLNLDDFRKIVGRCHMIRSSENC